MDGVTSGQVLEVDRLKSHDDGGGGGIRAQGPGQVQAVVVAGS